MKQSCQRICLGLSNCAYGTFVGVGAGTAGECFLSSTKNNQSVAFMSTYEINSTFFRPVLCTSSCSNFHRVEWGTVTNTGAPSQAPAHAWPPLPGESKAHYAQHAPKRAHSDLEAPDNPLINDYRELYSSTPTAMPTFSPSPATLYPTSIPTLPTWVSCDVYIVLFVAVFVAATNNLLNSGSHCFTNPEANIPPDDY